MEKYAIVKAESDDNIYLKVSDVIGIERVPQEVKDLVGRYVQGVKILECGLPAAGFIGKEGTKITGIFKYGVLGFIAFVGKEEDLDKEEFIHIFSNVSEEDYNQMKEYAEQQLKELDEDKENK